jgi:hypothetical protein
MCMFVRPEEVKECYLQSTVLDHPEETTDGSRRISLICSQLFGTLFNYISSMELSTALTRAIIQNGGVISYFEVMYQYLSYSEGPGISSGEMKQDPTAYEYYCQNCRLYSV